MLRRSVIVAAIALAASVGHAQTVVVDEVACLPKEANRAVRAVAQGVPGGGSVRLYFRRLHPLGAFYYNRMRPESAESYWSVFASAEHRRQHQLTEEWWEVLKTRDWMVLEGRDRTWLETWLEEREQEAAEYYAAIYDARGELVERSVTRLVEVLDAEECEVELDAREAGWARNLTVGETTELQNGRPLFHWLCDGVVTRISVGGIRQPDRYCRACVVASAESPRSPVSDREAPAP